MFERPPDHERSSVASDLPTLLASKHPGANMQVGNDTRHETVMQNTNETCTPDSADNARTRQRCNTGA